MTYIIRCVALIAGLLALVSTLSAAHAAGSLLRIACDGENQGAEVTVNGKFKGQCPLDVSVPEGSLRLQAVKQFGETHQGIFEREMRIGDGVIQRVDVDLIKKLTERGRELSLQKVEMLRNAYERDMVQYDQQLAGVKIAVTKCVEEETMSAYNRGGDCFSKGCVGWPCESYAEKNLRCYGNSKGQIDGQRFQPSCGKRFPEPKKPVAPPTVVE